MQTYPAVTKFVASSKRIFCKAIAMTEQKTTSLLRSSKFKNQCVFSLRLGFCVEDNDKKGAKNKTNDRLAATLWDDVQTDRNVFFALCQVPKTN